MILNFSDKSKKNINDSIDLVKIVALLIHAAKIDDHYSKEEEKIILEFLVSYSNNIKETGLHTENLSPEEALDVVKKAEQYENSSNQILEFTKEIKKMSENLKVPILKTLWKVVLSDNKSDVYESTLMRRICGLLYISDKLSGEIKLDILKGKKL